MTVEEDVFWRVWNLRRLIVIVDENLLRCFVCWCYIGSKKGSIDNNANDLVRLVPKAMSESAEVFSVMYGQASEQQCTMLG